MCKLETSRPVARSAERLDISKEKEKVNDLVRVYVDNQYITLDTKKIRLSERNDVA